MPFVESSVIIRAVQAWTSREKTDAVVEVHETTTSRLASPRPGKPSLVVLRQ